MVHSILVEDLKASKGPTDSNFSSHVVFLPDEKERRLTGQGGPMRSLVGVAVKLGSLSLLDTCCMLESRALSSTQRGDGDGRHECSA